DHSVAGQQQGFDDQTTRMKRKYIYTQVHRDRAAYTRGLVIEKTRMRIHALSCKEKRVHVGKLGFGPWYLDHGIGPRYLIQRVDPRYLVQGIGSKWIWTMVLSTA
ncbi:hypothetical protein, partial [Actinobacillus pleuropneumoniae]|uniref:hypothetical protein n=1 Tax=Actinobacillus pleuropneumoniae TaxID=715 RepID=UPI00227C54F1